MALSLGKGQEFNMQVGSLKVVYTYMSRVHTCLPHPSACLLRVSNQISSLVLRHLLGVFGTDSVLTGHDSVHLLQPEEFPALPGAPRPGPPPASSEAGDASKSDPPGGEVRSMLETEFVAHCSHPAVSATLYGE